MKIFIAFEGIEGCGKSTQAKLLFNRLLKRGEQVILTHEPGGTRLGSRIRYLLKWNNQLKISPQAELFLFAASRIELVQQVIQPMLDEGKIVLCDRFTASTLAYQGYGRGIKLNVVTSINNIATNGIEPDLTVLLDLPPEIGLRRKSNVTPDRFEKERLEFHHCVRQGYLELASANPSHWLVVDATLSKNVIQDTIFDRVSRLIN